MGMSPMQDDLTNGLLSGFNNEVPEGRIREMLSRGKGPQLQEALEEELGVRDERRPMRESTPSRGGRVSLREDERDAMIDIVSQNEKFEDTEFDELSDEELVSLVALSGKIGKNESRRKLITRQPVREELDDFGLGDLWSDTVQEVNLKTQGKLLKSFRENELEELYTDLLDDYEDKLYSMSEHEIKKLFRSELMGVLENW